MRNVQENFASDLLLLQHSFVPETLTCKVSIFTFNLLINFIYKIFTFTLYINISFST